MAFEQHALQCMSGVWSLRLSKRCLHPGARTVYAANVLLEKKIRREKGKCMKEVNISNSRIMYPSDAETHALMRAQSSV